MAREGVITWAKGITEQARKLSDWQASLGDLAPTTGFRDARRSFTRDRLFFLTACHMFFQHRDWAEEIGVLPASLFSEIDRFKIDVYAMRNKNVHVVEYFGGVGKWPEDWWHGSAEAGRVDASSTFNGKIGGRLDWKDLSTAATQILLNLSSQDVKIPE